MDLENRFKQSNRAQHSIAEKTVIESINAKVRAFLYELVEGTSSYRSLHSLTQQVEHQYHGRFIVELIQNAHDALLPTSDGSRTFSRIEIALKDEGEFGTLYVANDGMPFSESNFKSLSQLGQSDKNPQESIGNKGIGFRSVLEITDAPEIYSRSDSYSPCFDGFCFKFSPEVIRRFATPILELFYGNNDAYSPFGDSPLVDWEDRLLSKFRDKVAQIANTANMDADIWLTKELEHLSPYLLPFPTNSKESGVNVAEFESRGFSTLIRFPLKNAITLAHVREKLDALDDSTLLFLEKASTLVLDSGNMRRELTRHQTSRPLSNQRGREVCIAKGNDSTKQRYWIWTRDISLSSSPDFVQEALQQLPGKWPYLQQSAVSICVRLGAEEPEPGVLSIFLPTLLQTGSATHVNAPFFGDMSRTHIDFGSSDEAIASSGAIFNCFLLLQAARLALDVIHEELAGGGGDEARAAVDLLAPWGTDEYASNRWQVLTSNVAIELGLDINAIAWFLSDRGWATLSKTLLLPTLKSPIVITEKALRKHAGFSIYSMELNSRRNLIERLSKARALVVYPAAEELASTVESIALEIHKEELAVDWNRFWLDVDNLLNGDFRALAGKSVLLGNDDQLHAGGSDGCAVFFIPRQGASDDEEVEIEGDIKEIPSTLRPFVAFLSEQIQVYEEKNGRLQQTRVRKLLLDSKLVGRFRRDDILNDVLIARVPSLPIPLTSPDAALCMDILLWAFRLMAPLVVSGKAEKSLRLLKNLPAPCKGGWYPMGETSFGPDWPDTQGSVTYKYLARLKTPEARDAKQRLLLSPSDERWAGSGLANISFQKFVGVFDGLRLIPIDPRSWGSRFFASRHNFPQTPNSPQGWSDKDWNEYCSVVRKDARLSYNFGHYEIQRFYIFPGLDKYEEFDEETRILLMQVVLGSIGNWVEQWDSLYINRIEGNWDSIRLKSPLAYRLSNLSWLGISDGDVIEWSRPAERWHVSAIELARGRKWQFAHLKPMSGELANRLDIDSRLADMMRRLGTPRFDPELKSPSTQLLEALADAVMRGDIPHRDVFLGHVRSAWRGFEPVAGTIFPKRLLVQRGASRLTVENPNSNTPIYLPDSAKSFLAALRHFELPVIAIETEDAKRLAEQFTTAYPSCVLRVSALRTVPLVDGKPWNKSTQSKLRDNEELEWVIPALLTIAAFYGPQSQGTTSKTFRKLLDTFRDARLMVVGKIEIGLFREDTAVSPPQPVPALWLSVSQVLLVSKDWKTDVSVLSEALSNLIDREDLEIPIKLMLGIAGPEPEYKKIIRALEPLKLSEGHFGDVREHWRGDVGQIIEMLVPLLSIMRPDAKIGELVDLDTDESVTEFLDRLSDDRLHGQSIIRFARESVGMFEFGCKAFELFGESMQMSEWNAVLLLRGQQPLVNSEALGMFKVHLASSAQVMRSLLAHLVARQPEIGTFRSLLQKLDALACPEEFRDNFWNVSFSQAHSVVIPLLTQSFATSAEIEAVRLAISVQDLINRLVAKGVDAAFDPIHAARDNREMLRQALIKLQQIGLAWALNSGLPNPAMWEARVDEFLDQLSFEVEKSGFTHVWEHTDVWLLLRKLPGEASSSVFWSSVAEALNLDDLIVRLDLSNESLITANKKLDDQREALRRQKKIIEVCGKEFNGADDNLEGLWNHICYGLPVAELGDMASVDLQKPISLGNIEMRATGTRKVREPSYKPKPNFQSKSMEKLIGLSGEIHAFRSLQCTYGKSIVSASTWVSGNSTHVFPDNKTDDGMGCDFIVTLQDRTYYIEVKASEGESESFTLGSSEIRLAMDMAIKGKRRKKEIFLILRISNALSDAPSLALLPNPYDPQFRSLFVIEEADARVRYKSQM